MPDALSAALQPTPLIDSAHPAVVALAAEAVAGCGPEPVERAVALYLAVRDRFRYDPYQVDLRPQGIRASEVIRRGHGWCVPKAALLAAVCRASGIPARVGYADVRNHFSTERLREVVGTNDYVWHGYTSLYLNGAWVKATPAFNQALCAKLGVEPLPFDGRSDSVFQAEDAAGRRHMEYLRMRGEFDEVPLDAIRADFLLHYPRLVEMGELGELGEASFDQDLGREAPAAGVA